jgi:hypothetical protein
VSAHPDRPYPRRNSRPLCHAPSPQSKPAWMGRRCPHVAGPLGLRRAHDACCLTPEEALTAIRRMRAMGNYRQAEEFAAFLDASNPYA